MKQAIDHATTVVTIRTRVRYIGRDELACRVWPIPAAMFAVGLLQFVGHAFEGKPPGDQNMTPTMEFLTTTENELRDFQVITRFGVVRGITVRSRSVLGFIGARFQQFFGGEISLLTDLCEQTRAEAFAIAIDHAKALGANALIGVRYDATEIMPGVSEVLCYGTAIRIVARRELREGADA